MSSDWRRSAADPVGADANAAMEPWSLVVGCGFGDFAASEWWNGADLISVSI